MWKIIVLFMVGLINWESISYFVTIFHCAYILFNSYLGHLSFNALLHAAVANLQRAESNPSELLCDSFLALLARLRCLIGVRVRLSVLVRFSPVLGEFRLCARWPSQVGALQPPFHFLFVVGFRSPFGFTFACPRVSCG